MTSVNADENKKSRLPNRSTRYSTAPERTMEFTVPWHEFLARELEKIPDCTWAPKLAQRVCELGEDSNDYKYQSKLFWYEFQ